MSHPVEKELIKATTYKARTKFADRQDYLGSILNAVMKLEDSDFDDLSDEAATWANAAVEAKNGKSDIPDFDEVAEDASDEGDDEADEEVGDSRDDSEGSDSDDDDPDADTTDSDDVSDDEDDETSDDDDETEDEPEEKPTKKKVPAKIAKPVKAPPKPAKGKSEGQTKKKGSFGRDDDVVLDKWGCMDDSKNQRALAMFEKGATAKEVKDSVGGTYYNILKRIVADGHTMEKDGAIIRITHKDEKIKKATAKAPAKAKAEVKKKK